MDIIKSLMIAGLRSYDIETSELKINLDKLIKDTNFQLICEIKTILDEENLSDFDCVKKIVHLYEKYDIEISGRYNS